MPVSNSVSACPDEPTPRQWREIAPSMSTLARNLRAANREHATLVTTTDHRAMEPHTGLEAKAAYVLLGRSDCAALYEQPPRIPYRDYEGILRHHTFDFVMVTHSGRRIAVAVKPTVYADGLAELMKHIVPQLDRKFATGILVLTDLELSPVRVANAKAIHHSRRDRDPGIGELCYDRGSEFSAGETRRAVISTSATSAHAPKGHPELRAAGERIFLTIERRFMGHFTGRTFSNVVERGDYQSEKNASIPLDVLAQMLVRHVIDDYHNRPHAGLGGETPINAWNRIVKQTGRIPIPDKHLQRHAFGIERTATLRKAGVTLLGLRFHSQELYEKFLQVGSKNVTIRIDPTDIGAISVKFDTQWITALNVKRHLGGSKLSAWIATAKELSARYKAESEMSRAIVLAALRENETLARDYQREAGISEQLVTDEQITREMRHMKLGFRLPAWDDDLRINDARYDLLDDVIDVDGGPDVVVEETQPLQFDASSDESTSWEMGDRGESTP